MYGTLNRVYRVLSWPFFCTPYLQQCDLLLFLNFLAAPTTPRQTGSLAAPGSIDDVVTRMKNIELIELGKHRIQPWYFSPYPQVNPHFFHAITYYSYCQYLIFSMSGKKCLRLLFELWKYLELKLKYPDEFWFPEFTVWSWRFDQKVWIQTKDYQRLKNLKSHQFGQKTQKLIFY